MNLKTIGTFATQNKPLFSWRALQSSWFWAVDQWMEPHCRLLFLWDCKLPQGRESALFIICPQDCADCSMEKCFVNDVMYDSNIFLIKLQQWLVSTTEAFSLSTWKRSELLRRLTCSQRAVVPRILNSGCKTPMTKSEI